MTVFMLILSTLSDRRCGRVPNAAPVECHVSDLFFDAGFVCPVDVVELKATLTGFTAIAGPPVRLMTVGAKTFTPDGILVATIAARDDNSDHVVKTKSLSLRHYP